MNVKAGTKTTNTKTQAKANNTKKNSQAAPNTEIAKKIMTATRETNFKPKIEQARYSKTFDSFDAGITEMANLISTIKDLFAAYGLNIEETEVTIDDGLKAVLSIFTDNMPCIEEHKNFHYDLSMSANKCSIKTDKYLAFGWRVKPNRLPDNTIELKYIFHIIVFGTQEELVGELVKAGWEQVEYI